MRLVGLQFNMIWEDVDPEEYPEYVSSLVEARDGVAELVDDAVSAAE